MSGVIFESHCFSFHRRSFGSPLAKPTHLNTVKWHSRYFLFAFVECFFHKIPEAGGVVHFFEVAEFVNDEFVGFPLGEEYNFIVISKVSGG